MSAGIRFGPIPANAVHLCVDMQRLFAEDTPWRTPWMERVLPVIVGLCEAKAERTCFTRFVPPRHADEAEGAWRRYWERWEMLTLERLDPAMVELVGPLRTFVPPARVLDKAILSPWIDTPLDASMKAAGVDTVVVTGAETDVCVLAAVMGAVDRGYRVVVATDAICSSADDTHDALMDLYHQRYGQQIETAGTEEVLEAWGD